MEQRYLDSFCSRNVMRCDAFRLFSQVNIPCKYIQVLRFNYEVCPCHLPNFSFLVKWSRRTLVIFPDSFGAHFEDPRRRHTENWRGQKGLWLRILRQKSQIFPLFIFQSRQKVCYFSKRFRFEAI